MKRIFNFLLALVIAACTLPLTACKKSDVLYLNVFNAEEYISEYDEEWETVDAIAAFEKYATEKYGKKVVVNYSTFGTLENMYNELQLTKKKGKDGYTYAYDLVCPSDYMIQRMINEDMLERYDMNEDGTYAALGNYNDNASAFIQNLFNGKTEKDEVTGYVGKWSEYAACYMWGTMGFVYNPEVLAANTADGDITEMVNSWSLPWNAYFKNLGTIKDSIRDTYALAVGYTYREELMQLSSLKADGVLSQDEYQSALIKVFNNVNTPLLDEFKEAGLTGEKLDAVYSLFKKYEGKNTVDSVGVNLKNLKSNVYGFEVDSGKKDMAAGKIAINFAWSGDAAYTLDLADEDGTELFYEVPKEGSNIWFDAWVMPKGANKALAQDFVNFLSSPEIAISNMDYIGYVSPIAGDDIFEYVRETYELILPEEYNALTEEEKAEYYEIDYSYYFGNISDEYKTDDKVIVYCTSDQVGRQLTTQYPEQSVIDRCALMTALSRSELQALNAAWSDIKVGNVPVALMIAIPVIIALALIAFFVIKLLKKHGVTLRRKPRVYGKLISSERVR